ncbi:MAG TPA: restriction endonuclease subunit S [Trueperaceae bacterium]|nr:restriction endonuclease subunit S [Trueperaceae bacterium]
MTELGASTLKYGRGEVAPWPSVRLRRVASLVTAKANEKSFELGLEAVESWTGRLIESEATYEAAGVAFQKDDVLFGKLRPYLAKVYQAEKAGQAVGDFLVLRPSAQVHPRYLTYNLLAPHLIDRVSAGTYGSKMPRTSWEDLGGQEIMLPPLEEQRSIAAFLDYETARIDELVHEQELLLERHEERQIAALDVLLNRSNPLPGAAGVDTTGRQTAQERGWQRLRLKHLCDKLSVGLVVEPSQYVATDGLPYIYGADIKDGAVKWKEARRISKADSQRNSKSMLRAGDVLVVRVGEPGACAVVPPECEGGNCASVIHIRPSRKVSSDWLALALRASSLRHQLDLVIYGAAQKQFNVAHASEFWVDVPPKAIQLRILEEFEKRNAFHLDLMASTRQNIRLLRERRSALITSAVTGQIDVRNWQPRGTKLTAEVA